MTCIKATFKCTETEKAKFKDSACFLTISIGQESHEGERFMATMELVGKSFKSCIVSVHDSLQRYTIALDKEGEAEDFRDVAMQIGKAWLHRNEDALKKVSSLKIVHWDHWLGHPSYLGILEKVKKLFLEDAAYQEAFKETIVGYLNRYSRRVKAGVVFDRERAFQLCLDYLFEECAALCLWPEVQCAYELYPGKHNAAMIETRNRFVLNQYPNLLRAIIIGFNRRPDLAPQKFLI